MPKSELEYVSQPAVGVVVGVQAGAGVGVRVGRTGVGVCVTGSAVAVAMATGIGVRSMPTLRMSQAVRLDRRNRMVRIVRVDALGCLGEVPWMLNNLPS
jgi:hypothetical protein